MKKYASAEFILKLPIAKKERTLQMIYLIYIVLLAAAGASGVWLGEDLVRGLLHIDSEIRSPVTAVVVAVLLLWAAFGAAPSRFALRTLMVASLVGALVGGWFAGRHEAMLAFNDCVERGEQVREALKNYRKQQGHYPDSLEALGMEDLPGKRWLRGDLLQYIGAQRRYRLMFRDQLVTHTASETSPFMAQK